MGGGERYVVEDFVRSETFKVVIIRWGGGGDYRAEASELCKLREGVVMLAVVNRRSVSGF